MSSINLNIKNMDERNDVYILSIDGTLDTRTVPEFSESLTNYINEGKTKLILDCKDLKFISSAGLGTLVGAIEDIEEKDEKGFIKICNLSEEIFDVFEMMGFSELFEIYNSLEEAKKNV